MTSTSRPPVAARLTRATAQLDAPLAVVDLDAFDANARTLLDRAAGVRIRVATKSLRTRPLIERALALDGFAGLMCYSLAEGLWWAREGHGDVMVAYPSVDTAAFDALAADADLRSRVTVMIDSADHVRWIADHVTQPSGIRVALDVDASLRVGPAHLGVRRSPLREPADVERVIRAAHDAGLLVRGLMFYDAQIAGVQDAPHIRLMKRASHRDLMQRRHLVVEAARALTELDFVNGGGTGSLHLTREDRSLTELAAGSGLFAPTLFDGYDGLELTPAAYFALPVVRRAADEIVTAYGGGYIASGPAGWDRAPEPLTEYGLSYIGNQGPGEVQTPLKGAAARGLAIGDRVWFRHAKAGELAERFTQFALVQGDNVVGSAPTYRGEGQCFG